MATLLVKAIDGKKLETLMNYEYASEKMKELRDKFTSDCTECINPEMAPDFYISCHTP